MTSCYNNLLVIVYSPVLPIQMNHTTSIQITKRELSTSLHTVSSPSNIYHRRFIIISGSPRSCRVSNCCEGVQLLISNILKGIGTWYAGSGCDMACQDRSEEGVVNVLRTTKLRKRKPENYNRLEKVIERYRS